MKTHQLQHITSAKLARVNQNHAGKNLCGPAPWLAYKWSRFWGGKDDFSEPQRQFPENLLELRCHRGEGEVFGSRADWPSKARGGNCSAPPEFYFNSRPLPIAPTVARSPKSLRFVYEASSGILREELTLGTTDRFDPITLHQLFQGLLVYHIFSFIFILLIYFHFLHLFFLMRFRAYLIPC